MEKTTSAKKKLDIRQMFLAGVPKILRESRDNKNNLTNKPDNLTKNKLEHQDENEKENNSMKKKRKADEA